MIRALATMTLAQNDRALKGLLLVNKAAGSTSFQIVSDLRRLTGVKTIGHAGTLDPFATGLMLLLIGREYTRLSDQFLTSDKEYQATLKLGISTDTYDREGVTVNTSTLVPEESEVKKTIDRFQGLILQTPPMFSAKKVAGKKLYDLARKGIQIERKPVAVRLCITHARYHYPFIDFTVSCTKGTYIRSLAHDMGQALQCGAHLTALTRTKSGSFCLEDAIDQSQLKDPSCNISSRLILEI